MTRVPKLVLAAALAATLPAVAAARDCDHPGEVAWAPAAARPLPPPQPAPHAWRERSWRDREAAQLRAEFRALEEERARFHAQYGRRPGKIRRYDRRYEARRAELERRWYALQAMAVR
jgi:poly(3-hydroxybutyrate) depolymerase